MSNIDVFTSIGAVTLYVGVAVDPATDIVAAFSSRLDIGSCVCPIVFAISGWLVKTDELDLNVERGDNHGQSSSVR